MKPQQVIPTVIEQVASESFPEGSFMVDAHRAAEFINGKWVIYKPWQRAYWRLWFKRGGSHGSS